MKAPVQRKKGVVNRDKRIFVVRFLQILFFIFLFFYLLQWAVRAVLRWKINSIQKEMARKAGRPSQQKRAPKDGEVRVETGPTPGRKINERIGDYIEYQELDAEPNEGSNR